MNLINLEVYVNVSVLQPWAFQAREFLRKKLIGKEVCFTVEIKTNSGREYGMVYLGRGGWNNMYTFIMEKNTHII